MKLTFPCNKYIYICIIIFSSCKPINKKVDSVTFIPRSSSQLKSIGFKNVQGKAGVIEGLFIKSQGDTVIETNFYSEQKGDFLKTLSFPQKMSEKEVLYNITKRVDQVLLQDNHAILIKQDSIFFTVQAVVLQGNRMQVSFLSFNSLKGKQITKEYWYYSLQKGDSVNYKLKYNILMEKLMPVVK